MGATYTRQSTYADGDTITAAHTNDEFDQLLAAFAASTGHTHDGTTGEGGPISTLGGHALTFGSGTSGTDIIITFDGESNDGVLKWMEDEDYFEFSDDLLIASTEKIQFRDTGLYINSSADGQLDIVADTEIQIAATTVDINGLVDISGNLSVGGNLDVTGTFDLSDANFTNAGDIQLDSISGDADTNTSITFSGSDVITIATGGSTAATFNASQALTLSGILDVTDATDASDATGDTGALRTEGGASIAKKLYVGTDLDVSGASTLASLTVSGATTLAATSFGDANITNVGSIALDTITNDGTDVTVDSSGDIILDADGGDVFVKDAGTTFGSLTNSSGNLVIKSGTTTALTFSGANATLAGDLTISGDDLTMGTNTAGALLIADGTNFNPTVVGDLSAITTVAADDVFLAVDTSGGGLKKITRSAIVSGLAAGELSNIVEDTSPQLGGNLDTNSQNILIDDAHFIGDENGNEQIIFQTTSSAVNQFDVTNAATGNAPKLSTTGGDSNIDFELEAKGTGHLTVRGNTNAGAIQFNCESNSHGQIVQSQPHSASVTNTMLLPAGANSTLVSLVSTDTLTNKTLTSPVINTGTFGTSILPVSADGTTLGSASKEFSDLFLADGAVISFGNDQEITLTHVADDGLILKHVGSGDGKEPSFSFHAGDDDIAQDDVLGSIFFRAPDEGEGTDAILVAAGIEAVAEGDFTVSNNATKLVFKTAASEVASEKMSLSSAGLLTIADDLMIKDGGTIGVASTNDALTISSAGLLTVKDDLVIKSGGTIGGAGDTDLLTLGSAILTVAGEISVTTLDIGGTNVGSTAAELNLLDGSAKSTSSITVADSDAIIIIDGTTTKQIPASDIKTYASGSSATKGFAIAMAIVFG